MQRQRMHSLKTGLIFFVLHTLHGAVARVLQKAQMEEGTLVVMKALKCKPLVQCTRVVSM